MPVLKFVTVSIRWKEPRPDRQPDWFSHHRVIWTTLNSPVTVFHHFPFFLSILPHPCEWTLNFPEIAIIARVPCSESAITRALLFRDNSNHVHLRYDDPWFKVPLNSQVFSSLLVMIFYFFPFRGLIITTNLKVTCTFRCLLLLLTAFCY